MKKVNPSRGADLVAVFLAFPIVLALAAGAGGCASTFTGQITPLQKLENIPETATVSKVPIEVYFEKVEVVDNDAEKDFTPVAEAFADSFRQTIMDYFCQRGAFERCSPVLHPGAYRLTTKVVVENFRPPQGGETASIVGGFVPPLLGMIWSIPVGWGSCTMRVSWALMGPGGEQVWKVDETVADALGGCMDPDHFGFYLKDTAERILGPLSKAALVAEEEAARNRPKIAEPIPASNVAVNAPEPQPKPPVKKEVLAVFDVQDAAGRFKETVLVQLTSYLSTAMTATGRFTSVPREQLRQRLLDEKANTYKACYDNSCQIELGKAVAAQKTLSTQLLQVGDKCAVVANLYDLKTETSVGAATVDTGCAEGELLNAMGQVAAQITKGTTGQ